MGKRKADNELNSANSWTAPTDEEFAGMKRYKSFLLPPSKSYGVGQFVWLAHASINPRLAPKRARESISGSAPGTPANKNNGAKSDADAIPVVADPLGTGRVPGKYIRTEQDDEDDDKWDAGFWLGQIIEIRANGTTYVWMKIRWLCRKITELKEQNIKTGLPKTHPGGREVFMLGPQFDALQPVGSVEGPAQVIAFDERNALQAPLGERAIFYRSEARTPTDAELEQLKLKRPAQNAGKVAKKPRPSDLVPIGHLFPFREPTCYCGEAYRPNSRPEPMAMCTNSDCYKWFHLGCLDWGNSYRTEPTDALLENIQTSGVQFIKTLMSEEYDDVSPLFSPTGARIEDVVSSLIDDKANPVRPAEEYGATELSARKRLDAILPLSIYRAAQSPVVRGSPETGVVGNARKILRARQIIARNRETHKLLTGGKPIDDEVAQMAKEWLNLWIGPKDAQADIQAIERVQSGLSATADEAKRAYAKEEVDAGAHAGIKFQNGAAGVVGLGEEDGTPDVIEPPRFMLWLCPSCKHPI
ncbi:hypothetical protein IAU59_002524 [Kwoniella sp. CBS 9459]